MKNLRSIKPYVENSDPREKVIIKTSTINSVRKGAIPILHYFCVIKK